jgi:hypothetical protein
LPPGSACQELSLALSVLKSAGVLAVRGRERNRKEEREEAKADKAINEERKINKG